MKKQITVLLLLFIVGLIGKNISASDDPFYMEMQQLMDSVRIADGNVFAPKTYEKAEKAFRKAEEAINSNKKRKTIDEYLNETKGYAENALKATEVARLTLAEYLEPRSKAIAAKAPMHVPELYQKAEQIFIKAAQNVESGNVKNGLKEAEKSVPLFDEAEFEAIRAEIMGKADLLIQKAVEAEATKYALSTLDKARGARSKCDAILTKDRYERTESLKEIRRAEYEARHAANIAQSVRSMERNDQAWEQMMLVYEIQMKRVADEVGIGQLPFDNGPIAAADSLVLYIKDLQARNEKFDKTNLVMAEKMKNILAQFGEDTSEKDPIVLTERLGDHIITMLSEHEQMAYKVNNLQAGYKEVSAALEVRTEKEEKFKEAKALINPSEGEVLYSASNDIILRLPGLSFDVGRSDIKDEHVVLLDKVKTIIGMFPDSRLIVEGHTDASGDAVTNTALSEKRAYAVMQYLRESMLMSADRIKAFGYGSDKPVASNKTAEGRAKNRRIDILIMH